MDVTNTHDSSDAILPEGNALVPARTTYAPHELASRRRDGDGNTLPQRHAYAAPLVGDVPLEGTPFARVLSVLREVDPLKADMLHGRWETEVREANRTAQAVRHEEEEALVRRNRRAVEENARIDMGQQEQLAACKGALQPHMARRDEISARLDDSQHAAAAAVTRAGGTYDPADPSEAAVLRVTPRPLDVIAGDLKLPYPESDRLSHMHPVVGHIATIGFGALFGLSLGLIFGYRGGSLLLHPIALVLFLGLGALWAYLSRSFLCATTERAASRYYLGHGPRSWVPFLAGTVGAVAVTLILDAAVGQAGVLRLAHAQDVAYSLSGEAYAAGRGAASVLVALAFALPYAGFAVWEGYHKGMYGPVMNRLKDCQDKEARLAEAHRRNDPVAQEAMNRIADVKDGLRQQGEHESRMRAAAEPYVAKNQALERQRLPIRDRLDEEAQGRADQAIHQARGVQEEWKQEFARALGENSPASSR
jgi:hypothetical protein